MGRLREVETTRASRRPDSASARPAPRRVVETSAAWVPALAPLAQPPRAQPASASVVAAEPDEQSALAAPREVALSVGLPRLVAPSPPAAPPECSRASAVAVRGA